MRIVRCCLLLLAWSLTISLAAESASAKPNIILILADDLGFSDIGCYGSEIPTPHLDSLAAGGLRFTQFYNTARCSPTRAAVMTGLNPHQAGMGKLAEESIGTTGVKPPGYLGYLNDRCATLAEILRPAGYQTYISGKWHLGMRDESKWPLQRGFDRFYGILAGATSYLRPEKKRPLTLDNQTLPAPEESDYYTSDAFTDFAIKAVRETKESTPFFLYLAFNAPHWPLQAKKNDIDLFVGKYRAGWDKIRLERFSKMKDLGIISQDMVLSERDSGARAWNSLPEREKTDLDYRMAVYAAQVHRLDANVGRLVSELRAQGKFDNTLIAFISDNGACAEPYTDLGGGKQEQINDPNAMGNVSYGTGWANCSNTPFRRFKSMLHEGGISAPLIVSWPNGLKTKPGSLTNTPSYLTDFMPTFIEVSGATYPKERNGNVLTPLVGRSLLPIFSASTSQVESRVLYWEQYGFKAIRVGDMKAIFSPNDMYDKRGSGQWELYDLAHDRSELHDLAQARPEELKTLIQQWSAWAERSQVNSSEDRARGSDKKGKKNNPGEE